MDDPSNLPAILAAGAGSGTLVWAKENWLKTSYPDTPPVITSHPVTQTVTPGTAVNLTVIATGNGTLAYQWRKGGATINGATGPTLPIPSAQFANAGVYDVVVSENGISAISNPATLAVTDTFAAWSTRNGLTTPDADGDGVPDLIEFGLGLDPHQASTQGLPTLSTEAGQRVFRFTRPVNLAGLTYTVQISTDLIDWSGKVEAVMESSTATTATFVATLPQGHPMICARLQIQLIP
jgi:hypothetical protein